MSRGFTEKDFAYEKISDIWKDFVDQYDLSRRIELLVDDFLGQTKIEGKSCLDCGCGLGFFSKAIMKYGPSRLVSVDISPKLVAHLKESDQRIDFLVADIMELDCTLTEMFDLVISSEVIEHTPNPRVATLQIAKRVKKGGFLAISCPNAKWLWLLKLANKMGLRKKYCGYENWVLPDDLVKWINESGFEILRKEGLHFIPWQGLPKAIHSKIDKKLGRANYSNGINLAVLAQKK
jgi:2-polyprenyl-3-methyl-5-hydroxy-6-metoxy-1,4-benzoquinol methylase